MADNASHALASSATVKPTLSIEKEVVAIRNVWTPKKILIDCNIAFSHVFFVLYIMNFIEI